MRTGTYLCALAMIACLSGPLSPADEPDSKAVRGQPADQSKSEGETESQVADPKDDPNRQPSVWMRRKLEYSKKILSGLTSGDFDEIADSARKMKLLDRIELFVRGRSPSYRAQFGVFQDANRELIREADKKNLDGAALAFTQLTISCIQCHKRLREMPADGADAVEPEPAPAK